MRLCTLYQTIIFTVTVNITRPNPFSKIVSIHFDFFFKFNSDCYGKRRCKWSNTFCFTPTTITISVRCNSFNCYSAITKESHIRIWNNFWSTFLVSCMNIFFTYKATQTNPQIHFTNMNNKDIITCTSQVHQNVL